MFKILPLQNYKMSDSIMLGLVVIITINSYERLMIIRGSVRENVLEDILKE